jgi:hypothetical protein
MDDCATIHFVGAGPGDPGLLTVRGRDLLAVAGFLATDAELGDGFLPHLAAGAQARERWTTPHADCHDVELLAEEVAKASMARLKGPLFNNEVDAIVVDGRTADGGDGGGVGRAGLCLAAGCNRRGGAGPGHRCALASPGAAFDCGRVRARRGAD